MVMALRIFGQILAAFSGAIVFLIVWMIIKGIGRLFGKVAEPIHKAGKGKFK
jgi:hypothetical protein